MGRVIAVPNFTLLQYDKEDLPAPFKAEYSCSWLPGFIGPIPSTTLDKKTNF